MHAHTLRSIHGSKRQSQPNEQTGIISCADIDDHVVAQYIAICVNGLYYIQKLDFIPVTASNTVQHISALCGTPLATGNGLDDCSDLETLITNAVAGDMEDYNVDTLDEFLQHSITAVYSDTFDIPTQVPISCHGKPAHSHNKYTQDILTYLTWHQRLAHSSPQTLQQTSRLVDGMPKIQANAVPPLVTCRACDVARLKKNPRGQVIPDALTMQPGHVFHMDIGFIRGPPNLEAVVDRQEEDALPRTIKSCQGYTCYLLIIDRQSCYRWVFPLKQNPFLHSSCKNSSISKRQQQMHPSRMALRNAHIKH